MSKLKYDVQNENLKILILRFMQASERCAMKTRKCERKDFIRLYQKIGWADFDELQVNNTTLNKGIKS